MREILKVVLFMAAGLNCSVVFMGIALGRADLAILGGCSALLCLVGPYLKNSEEENK